MRHEINSENTKRALAEGMKAVINQKKSSEKITVDKIAEKCGVNRNTFYYHFANIHELLLWTLHNDFYVPMGALENSDDPQGKEIRDFIISYLMGNNKLMKFAYEYLGYCQFRDFFVTELHPVIMAYIEKIEKSRGLSLSAAYKNFVAEFHSEQLSALFLLQFHRPDCYHGDGIRISQKMIFEVSIPNLLSYGASSASNSQRGDASLDFPQ